MLNSKLLSSNRSQEIPNEAAELTREGDDDLLLHQAAAEQVPTALEEAPLGFPGEIEVEFGLGLLPAGERRGDFGREETVLHGFDQDPAGVAVTGLSHEAQTAALAGGGFFGYKAEVAQR